MSKNSWLDVGASKDEIDKRGIWLDNDFWINPTIPTAIYLNSFKDKSTYGRYHSSFGVSEREGKEKSIPRNILYKFLIYCKSYESS